MGSDRKTGPEFAAMASSGMSAGEILGALTSEPASFFGRPRSGAVEVGNRGDLTVLDTTTSELEPRDFSRIHAAIRRGETVWPARDEFHGRTHG